MISASWDNALRLFDDNNTDREGEFRTEINRHHGPINYVDFNDEQLYSASASDDGEIILYNHLSHRQEGHLAPALSTKDYPEVKICKFLPGHDCLVSADVDGYLNFYATPPHPKRGMCILRRREFNEKEQLVHTSKSEEEKVAYSIRGMDFDAEEQILYTGDEIGYIQKWDLKGLLSKLKREKEIHEYQIKKQKQSEKLDSTFVTATDLDDEKIRDYEASDVPLILMK